MERISTLIISKIPIKKLFVIGLAMLLVLGSATFALAQVTSNFQQVINAGTLEVDITDDSYVTVGSPSVAMNDVTFSFTCQTATGTLGTTAQQIYIVNPDVADNGFTVSIAGSSPTAVWDSAGTDFDFNDPTGSGCTDGGDADSLAGQMTINASGATLAAGACASCDTTGLSLGSSAAFNEGTLNSITLLTASAGSDDIGDWYIRNIAISQTIPAEQPAASDYNIDMVISILSS